MDGRCDEKVEPVSPVQVAVLVVLAMILVFYVARFLGGLGAGRENFVSPKAQEVHDRAQEVFADGGGDARYSEYKKRVPGADPVQYSDVRRLFKAGQMTPAEVERVI